MRGGSEDLRLWLLLLLVKMVEWMRCRLRRALWLGGTRSRRVLALMLMLMLVLGLQAMMETQSSGTRTGILGVCVRKRRSEGSGDLALGECHMALS